MAGSHMTNTDRDSYKVREISEKAKKQIHIVAKNASAHGRKNANKLLETVSEYKDQTRKYIKKHPVGSLALIILAAVSVAAVILGIIFKK